MAFWIRTLENKDDMHKISDFLEDNRKEYLHTMIQATKMMFEVFIHFGPIKMTIPPEMFGRAYLVKNARLTRVMVVQSTTPCEGRRKVKHFI